MTAEGQAETALSGTRRARRTYQGVVISDTGDKTVKVRVEVLTRHPRYKKYLRWRTRLHVHDEGNQARVGDTVEIMECRPLSKTKNWRLVRVVTPESGTPGSEG